MWLTHPNRSDRHTLPEQIHPHHPSRNIHRIRPNGGCAIQATPAPPHHGRSRYEADERSRSRVERHPPAPQLRSLSPSAASEFLSSSRLRIASWVVFQAVVDPHVPAPGGNGQDRIESVRTEAVTSAQQEVGLHANVRTSDRKRGRDAREHVPRETKDMANVTSALAMPRVKTGRTVNGRSRVQRTATLVQRPAANLQAKVAKRSSLGRSWGDRTSLKPCKPAVVASASTPAVSAASTTPPTTWKGADLKKLAACVLTAAVVWVIPPPAGITKQAWHLLAIFLGTIGEKQCDVGAPS